VCVCVCMCACARFVLASEREITGICRMILMMMMITAIMKTEGRRNYVMGGWIVYNFFFIKHDNECQFYTVAVKYLYKATAS